MSNYELYNAEPDTLKVCEHCLGAIWSREGNQHIINTYDADFLDEDVEWKCDWCGETEIDKLYEI